MEVKPGYKMTEVGVIPEDWEAGKLGRCSTFKTGPFGSALHQSDYVYDGVPVINPMQIIDGMLVPTSHMSVAEQAARRLTDFRICFGDIVIGRRGEMGRCAYVLPQQDGWLCGTGSMIIRVSRSVDARFIQRLLASAPIIAAIENTSVGSTMINLNQSTLANLVIPLPPTKAEQEAIASTLSDVDALIESLEQLVAKKRNIKQGAMQELLTGKRRLPGFQHKAGFNDSEVGLIPEDWSLPKLGELFSFKNGLNKAKQYFGYGVPIVNYMDVYKLNRIYRRNICGLVDVNDGEIDSFSVRKGDVFFTRTSETAEEVGLAAVLLDDVKDTVFSGFVLRARPKNDMLVDTYKAYCFSSQVVRKQVISKSTYTTRALTNGRILSSVSLPLPGAKLEQEAIASALADMDVELSSLESELSKARHLKQAMMQELLTGRIRLV